MPSLREVQHAMRRGLLQEADGDAAACIVAAGLAPGQRLSVYRNTLFGALANALRLSFPAVHRLVGADFLVLKDVWDATHPAPPQLMGQLLHLFDAPNRFGLPAFYTLHVWAWKPSPTGTFVNWHANVSCDAFSGQNH